MRAPEPINIMTYADSEFTLAFDISSGHRVAVEGEKMPGERTVDSMPELMQELLHRAEPQQMVQILQSDPAQVRLDALYRKGEIRSVQLYLRDLRRPLEEEPPYRWYRFVYTCVGEGITSAAVLLVSAYDITRQIREQQRQYRLSQYDPYTGFLRKEAFEGACRRMRSDRSLEHTLNAVVIVGIDHFEEIRSRMSMSVCDILIGKVAGALRPYVEDENMAARMSDSEFLLTFHNCADQQELRSRILDLQKEVRVKIEDHRYITVSAGAAICSHDEKECYHCSYELARAALRQAQQNGIGQVTFYSDLEGEESLTPEGRYHSEPGSRDVYLRTFGTFEVFVDGHAMRFHSKKSKELLALITDCHSDGITSNEAIRCLWPDEPLNTTTYSRYRKIAYRLKKELEENGIGDIIRIEDNRRSLHLDRVRCDAYDYLAHPDLHADRYHEDYMENYDWGGEGRLLSGLK